MGRGAHRRPHREAARAACACARSFGVGVCVRCPLRVGTATSGGVRHVNRSTDRSLRETRGTAQAEELGQSVDAVTRN